MKSILNSYTVPILELLSNVNNKKKHTSIIYIFTKKYQYHKKTYIEDSPFLCDCNHKRDRKLSKKEKDGSLQRFLIIVILHDREHLHKNYIK